MRIYAQGVLKMVENSSFKDAKTGQTVSYFTHYIQDAEGKLAKFGASEDYSEFIDVPIVAECDLKPDFQKPNLYRAKLTSVRKQD